MNREFQFISRQQVLVIFGLLVAVCVGILLGNLWETSSEAAWKTPAQVKIEPSESQEDRSETASIPMGGFAEVAEKIAPSVVNISSEVIVRPPQQQERRELPESFQRFFPDDFFERFFGPMIPQKRQSLGSGVILDPEGYILTNHHVVAPLENRGVRELADQIEVQLSTGKTHPAKVVGVDPESDIAVLKIDVGEALPAATIGDSKKLRAGDWVVAIGSPFGLKHTVTAGIISAMERIVPTGIFGDYIQTDAAINPGNSGGPLVNLEGEVIGINTFIATNTGNFAGVGFAVPSSVFVNSYNQLITEGTIERGWLGVSMNTQPMTPEMADYFGVAGDDPEGIKDGDGVVVAQLIDEHGEPADSGPAAQAGVQEGDVIVRFGDREIETNWDLRSAVANTPPGKSVELTLVRNGEVINVDVELARRSLEEEQRARAEGYSLDEEEKREEPQEIGLEFRTLSSRDANQLGLDDVEGVLILNVEPGSLADGAGLTEQQVITHVNGTEVTTAREFKNLVTDIPSGQGVILRVVSAGPERQKVVSYTSFVKP